MGFPVNCDAISFMSAAMKPSILFEQGYIRQSRPVYILTGTIIGYTVYYASYPLHRFLKKKLQGRLSPNDSQKDPQKQVKYACFYVAFLLINIAILLSTCVLFEKIVCYVLKTTPRWFPVFPLMIALLISNPLCKAFFWTVHLQLFNILMPVLALYIALHLNKKPKRFSSLLVISILSGALVLCYANAILLLPIICLSYWREKHVIQKHVYSKKFFRLVMLIVAFFSVTILWISLLRIRGVVIYNNEVKVAREFVWMEDIMKRPMVFWNELAANTKAFLKTFPALGFTSLILLITSIGKKKEIFQTFRQTKNDNQLKSTISLVIFTIILFVLFYWLMGYNAERLTTALNPFIIYLSTLLFAKEPPNRKLTILLFILITGIHLFTVFSYGPFS
jgi:hypothetical protein